MVYQRAEDPNPGIRFAGCDQPLQAISVEEGIFIQNQDPIRPLLDCSPDPNVVIAGIPAIFS
jgi:hypothetical protein